MWHVRSSDNWLVEAGCHGVIRDIKNHQNHQNLKYIAAGGIITLPIAHCLLRGVIRSLFEYSLDTKVKSVPDKHPVVFNQAARAAVKVCIQVANAYIHEPAICISHLNPA